MFRFNLCVVLVVVSMACLLGLNTASAALVAGWSFDSNFDAQVGGPTYDGTDLNGASISAVQSKFGGGSLKIVKANSQAVRIDTDPMAAGGDDWSYSLWYYLDLPNDTTGAYQLFADYNLGAFSNLLKRDDGGNLIEITRTSGGVVGTIQGGQGSNNQVWVNVAQVSDYDSVADQTTVSQYINGTLGSSFPVVKSGSPVGGDELYIGSDDTLAFSWEGYIDDFAVYDHALTSGEIAALQNATAFGPPR